MIASAVLSFGLKFLRKNSVKKNSKCHRYREKRVNVPETLVIEMDEKTIRMELQSPDSVEWFLELRAAKRASLPYTKISRFEGMKYFVGTERGSFDRSGGISKLRIIP